MIAEERLLEILLSPVVTEKTSIIGEKTNTFTFKVAKNATKREVKKAVEKLLDVQVASVNTLVRKGKVKRTRFGQGRITDVKRAYITLKDGQDLDISTHVQ